MPIPSPIYPQKAIQLLLEGKLRPNVHPCPHLKNFPDGIDICKSVRRSVDGRLFGGNKH
jgi:hypothetical protein